MGYKDKDMQKQAQRDWYEKNKKLTYERTISTRDKRKEIVNNLKESSPCADCGVSYPYYVMDFDHVDTESKLKAVSTLLRTSSIEVVLQEIKKCELVCANCHRTRTHKQRCSGCYRC